MQDLLPITFLFQGYFIILHMFVNHLQDMLSSLVRLRDASGEDRCRFAFKFIDIEKNGRVSLFEFTKFVESVHALNGYGKHVGADLTCLKH